MRILTLPLLLAIGMPAVATAQSMVQPLPGSSDADLLAATMRRVAANPLDVDALLTAGEQSLRVDDLSGAASLFARAEKIDPRNGRIKAGMASILVRSERPGEALRYFTQAAASGLDPRRFAADRGFAYDLVGDQPRAQVDYRVALANGADDETVRRYALSLGISGRGDEALRQLGPLLGRSDRAAWRARAFVLAMTGDQTGAERIAVTMMPPGMAEGLRPFFQRLPSLPAADRAFAVHFGEVRPTPERIADARLAPMLPPLSPEARPVQVASATTRQETRGERRRREAAERRARREQVAVAAAAAQAARNAPGRVTLAAVTSVPAAAAVITPPVQVAALAPTRPSVPQVLAAPQVAAATSVPAATQVVAAGPVPTTLVPVAANGALPLPGFSSMLPASAPPIPALVTNVAATGSSATAQPGFTEPVAIAAAATAAPVASPEVGLAPLVTTPAVAVASVDTPAVPTTQAPAGTVALAAVNSGNRPAGAAARPPNRAPAADSVLARIVASLSIPAAELGVAAPVRAQPPAAGLSEGAARTADALRTKAARDAKAELVAQRLVSARPADTRRGRKGTAEPTELARVDDASPKSPRTRRGAAAVEPEADTTTTRGSKRADAKKAAADRKTAADKKLADGKVAEERRASRSNPSRIWVQVAGGANAGDLPKAWATTKAKAPQLLGTRSAYSAKLRATNRVVTGPFKTDAEARAFVNQLAKSGVSAFPFTSDAGEAVTRLPGK